MNFILVYIQKWQPNVNKTKPHVIIGITPDKPWYTQNFTMVCGYKLLIALNHSKNLRIPWFLSGVIMSTPLERVCEQRFTNAPCKNTQHN